MNLEQLKTADLIPYARNTRTHSDAQVAQIAGSIREFGFTNPVLIDAENGIIAGHGRVMAARKLGIEEVPCIRLGHLTETQKRAYVIADNKLALNAGWDEELLALELSDLRGLDFDLGLIGFDADEIEKALVPQDVDSTPTGYTDKIDAPVYEPKAEAPPVLELLDKKRFDELVAKVNESALDQKTKDFLNSAATRHIVFDYGKIAEFYCHAEKDVQELMEEMALVIIDYNKALQLGYVKMKQAIVELIEEGQDDEE
jgi:hypothetical protein